jgi:hypothetical protein
MSLPEVVLLLETENKRSLNRLLLQADSQMLATSAPWSKKAIRLWGKWKKEVRKMGHLEMIH